MTMNHENTQIEQSLQDAIDYFNRVPLYALNPAEIVRDKFSQALNARIQKVIDGHAKPTTKSSIIDFVRRYGNDCLDLILPVMEETCEAVIQTLKTVKWHAKEIANAQDKIADMNEEAYILEETIKQRKEQIAALDAEFPDPRARSAYHLYNRISASEANEDEHTKQRRITSAGLVAASYLGLQRYEINTAKQPKQD